MSIGDLKGRVVITNAGTAALQQVRRDLDGIANASKRISFSGLNTFAANATASLKHQIDRMQRMAAPGSAALAGAGLGVKSLIDQTKDFNEAKFGYGFARLSDFMKDGKTDLQGWKAEIDKTAKEVQDKAKAFGAIPASVMKAREEVEKLGFKDAESNSIYEAALGLHLSEPGKLASGNAAQFMGAVYRAYEKERQALATKLGKDANDPEFVKNYVKGMAAKAAVAGAESALGPADVIEGMRQYAPQWAGLGISYDFALAALAHGANYGFRAPELGTAYKSMAMRLIKPTGEGMRWMNRLRIDRSKYMEMDVADPKRGVNQMQALLGNALGKKDKFWLEQELIKAQKGGYTTNPEFRGALVNQLEKRLGKGFVGKRMEIESAFDDGVLAPTKFKEGGFDGLIREIIKSKAGPAALGTIFEGRHIARNDPMFSFYDKMYALFEKIGSVDGSFMDAVVDARKVSEAGKTDQVSGSWQNLMIQLEQSGGIIDKVKDSITTLNGALSALPTGAISTLVGGLVALAGVTGLGMAAKAAPLAAAGARTMWGMSGIPALATGAATWYGGAKLAGKAATLFGPGAAVSGGRALAFGLGRAILPGMLAAYAAYEGYQGYQREGWWGAAKGAGWALNPLSIFMPGGANAAEAGAGDGPIEGMPPIGEFLKPGGVGAGGGASESQAFVDQLLAPIRSLDLSAEGARVADTFIAGFRSKVGEAAAAAGDMAGAMRSAAGSGGPSRVPLNTGPAMSGSAQ